MDVRLDGLEAEPVHHLHRRRDDAGGDDVADGRGAGLDVVEVEQHRAHDRRVLGEPHADRRGDAAHPLAADERRRAGRNRAARGPRRRARSTVPSGRTTSRATMWLAVTPSARQCGPPELFATLPPIVHVCWLLGSGAKCRPWPATARLRSRLSTPGSTHARRASGSTERIRFIFVSEMTTASVGRHGSPGQTGARAAGDERNAGGGGDAHARRDLGGGDGEADDGRPRRSCARRRGDTATARRHRSRTRSAPIARRSSSASGGRAGHRRVGTIGPAHEDHPSRFDDLAVDEHLVTVGEMITEADQPAVALGPQLVLAPPGGGDIPRGPPR